MESVIEPKNVDFVVEPTVFTEETKTKITQAIVQYKETGEKPVNAELTTQESINVKAHIGRVKSNTPKK